MADAGKQSKVLVLILVMVLVLTLPLILAAAGLVVAFGDLPDAKRDMMVAALALSMAALTIAPSAAAALTLALITVALALRRCRNQAARDEKQERRARACCYPKVDASRFLL